MYPHHEESLKLALEYFKTKSRVADGLIAVIFGGSVAKGVERPDSDLDFMVIVTDEKHEELKAAGLTVEAIMGVCTYPEGYLDVKYYPKSFIRAVAERGSEPARNAWLKCQCLYTVDPEIPELCREVARFQTELVEDKMLSFFGQFELASGYFFPMGKNDPILRTRAATDIVVFGLRMILEENEILFPCIKSMRMMIEKAPKKPENILALADRLLETLSDEDKDAFTSAVMGCLTWQPPENWDLATSRYTEDQELWWLNPRPLIVEW